MTRPGNRTARRLAAAAAVSATGAAARTPTGGAGRTRGSAGTAADPPATAGDGRLPVPGVAVSAAVLLLTVLLLTGLALTRRRRHRTDVGGTR